MVEKLRHRKLADKFREIIVLCLILPLIVVFTLMNGVVTNQFLNKQYEKELEILKQSRPSIENVLDDILDLSRNTACSREVQTLLNGHQEAEETEDALRDVMLYIEQQVYTKKYIASVSLFSENQILYQYGSYYEREGILEETDKKKELERLQGKALWDSTGILSGYTGGRGNEPGVSLYRIVNHLYRIVPIGIERVTIKEEYLCSLYGNGDSEAGNEAYIFDRNGNIVSAQNKKMLGETVPVGIWEKAESAEGYFTEETEGNAVFYYKLPVNGWTVVQVRSLADLRSQISMLRLIFLCALTLSIVFGVIFSVWQKRAVIDPIVKLARDVEAVGEGNYQIHMYSGNLDEVGQLNRSVVQMAERIRELIETVYKGQLQYKEAEILSLQSQINPHFLYNTLDTIRWIAVEHQETELAEQIEALSGMFRHVLNNGQEITTVGEEIRHLKHYLILQKSRFGEKIQVQMQIDEALYPCRVLKLILQPLVENAFVHGLEEKVGGGRIWITVEAQGEDIVYVVQDNGVGTDAKRIEELLRQKEPAKKIYALKNVNDRIRLKYGAGYGVEFESAVGKGTTVRVRTAREISGRQEGVCHESADSR